MGDTQPLIIQGGMGVGVSGWRLARAVGTTGHLGVVSGVALDAVLARRLQSGDPDGSARWALSRLPIPGLAERILAHYFVPGGLSDDAPFRPIPRLGLRPSTARDELIVAGNFVEVCLAKDGHSGPVGINYLEKIQLATPAAAYGAMLAGVDYVLMGAGIPTEIPRLLDRLARAEAGKITVTVSGSASGEQHHVGLDPDALWPGPPPQLARPTFLAIVSSAILAAYLVRDPACAPDGFVLETPIAGGHSAPPRGALNLSAEGEPVYGPRDNIDEAKVAALGRPFWRAGGHAGPGALAAARAAGAAGIQVGSAFALCRESGIDPQLRHEMVERALAGALIVRNDPRTSPAGMPFKTVQLPTSVSDEKVYANRARLCDLGYLRVPYRRDDGGIGYRCPAEPVAVYVRKGGSEDDAVDRRCLCNGLMATIGLGQRHDDGVEPPLLTLGQQLEFLPELVARSGVDFTAADVVAYLLAGA